MISAFGFLRFSCSLLIHCFVKTKKKRNSGSRRRHTRSDSEEEEECVYLPKNATTAAKSAIAKVAIRVRPPRPVEKPRLASFLAYFTKKNLLPQQPHPVITCSRMPCDKGDENEEVEVWNRESEVRHRRTGNKMDGFCEVVGGEASPVTLEEVMMKGSEGSLSCDECSYYPSDDVLSEAESYDAFGSESDLSPRTSSESLKTNRGLNPMFYDMEVSEDDEPCTLQRPSAFRRINSVVESDAKLKEKAHVVSSRQLLLNPAFGVDSSLSREGSDAGETEIETGTKLRSLKSVVSQGCRVRPMSTALVGCEYIGHTSLNPTYGDHSISSDESEDDGATEIEDQEEEEEEEEVSLQNSPRSENKPLWHRNEIYHSPFYAAQFSQEPCSERPAYDQREIHDVSIVDAYPVATFPSLTVNGHRIENMGTLTWKNVAFSHSDRSDSDYEIAEASKIVENLQVQWKETLRTDSLDNSVLFQQQQSSVATTTTTTASSAQQQSYLYPYSSTHLEDIHFRSSRDWTENVPEDVDRRPAVKAITRTLVTPVHSISMDTFEDVDIKCQATAATAAASVLGSCSKNHGNLSSLNEKQLPVSVSSTARSSSSILSTGLKHTRWALRSISLLLDRVDLFSASEKQK